MFYLQPEEIQRNTLKTIIKSLLADRKYSIISLLPFRIIYETRLPFCVFLSKLQCCHSIVALIKMRRFLSLDDIKGLFILMLVHKLMWMWSFYFSQYCIFSNPLITYIISQSQCEDSYVESAVWRERELRGVCLLAEAVCQPAPGGAAVHHALRHVARNRNVQVLTLIHITQILTVQYNSLLTRVKYQIPLTPFYSMVQCAVHCTVQYSYTYTKKVRCYAWERWMYSYRAVIRRLHNFVSLRLFPPSSVTLPPLFRTSWWIPCAVRVLALLCEHLIANG